MQIPPRGRQGYDAGAAGGTRPRTRSMPGMPACPGVVGVGRLAGVADEHGVLQALAASLDSDDMQQVMAAVWNLFDVGERLADVLAWQDGVDPVQARAAAQSCRLALRYLTAPSFGRPVATPHPGPDAAADYARLLERAARLLHDPAGTTIQPDPAARRTAGEHAVAAHRAFAAIAGRMTA